MSNEGNVVITSTMLKLLDIEQERSGNNTCFRIVGRSGKVNVLLSGMIISTAFSCSARSMVRHLTKIIYS